MRQVELRMIESIDLSRCTGCGICDQVCPADVIHMTEVVVPPGIATRQQPKAFPVIKFREHCITCFSCEIFCPEKVVDVHPVVKNRPRPW
jgi:Pyruvate/2-oxoacid:ferredoxin oxidoreductase delta subunit